jgi:hypothetical protein
MPGTIFISHRTEYASLVRELKKAIETTSRGQIDVIISEDLSGAQDWREAIKSHLQRAKYLFLVHGAAYEDWSCASTRLATSRAPIPDRNISVLLIVSPVPRWTLRVP